MKYFDENEIKPLFLGPKAENAQLFEQLLVECFRDHCFWRRNFHPEDVNWVREMDKFSAPFFSTQSTLRDGLNRLIAELKRCSPTFHFRYLGHMHTDLQIAGVLGEFAAMFYSQNNVVAEASPVTARLEVRAIRRIVEMLGYSNANDVTPWGHICSGGTAANIQGIWVARNVRLIPVSLYLALRRLQADSGSLPKELIEELTQLTIKHGASHRQVLKLSTFELLNVGINEILTLRARIRDIALRHLAKSHAGISRTSEDLQRLSLRLADELLRADSPVEVGNAVVEQRLTGHGLQPLSKYPWKVFVASTKHYSIEKIADLLGLGRQAVSSIPIDTDFCIDVDALRVQIECDFEEAKQQDAGHLALAVVAIMGSTEEGAVDDVGAILEVRDELREKGLEFWIHADAAYGGYASSMLRKSDGEDSACSPATYFTRLAGRDLGKDVYVDHWSKTLQRLDAMSESDSITVDPHKMGLLPYPAGVVAFKDERAKDAVSCDAPYLFEGEQIDAFPGRYTLEGSRPGHVAAGVYLAHEVLKLDQFGHGAVVGRSLLAAAQLHQELPAIVRSHQPRVQIHFLAKPALNILNFILTHEEVSTLAEQNTLTELLLEEFSADADRTRPISDFSFFFVSTSLPLRKYRHVLEPFLSKAGVRVSEQEWQTDSLRVFRSVILHPHLLGAQTRIEGEQVPLLNELGRVLALSGHEMVGRIAERRSKRLISRFKRPPRILILDDEDEQIDLMKNILLQYLEPYEPIIAKTIDSAKSIIDNELGRKRPIDLFISDLNLQEDKGKSALNSSGPKVVEYLRAAMGSTVPIIISSVFSGISREERQQIVADRLFDKTQFVKASGPREFANLVIELLEARVCQRGDDLRLPERVQTKILKG